MCGSRCSERFDGVYTRNITWYRPKGVRGDCFAFLPVSNPFSTTTTTADSTATARNVSFLGIAYFLGGGGWRPSIHSRFGEISFVRLRLAKHNKAQGDLKAPASASASEIRATFVATFGVSAICINTFMDCAYENRVVFCICIYNCSNPRYIQTLIHTLKLYTQHRVHCAFYGTIL